MPVQRAPGLGNGQWAQQLLHAVTLVPLATLQQTIGMASQLQLVTIRLGLNLQSTVMMPVSGDLTHVSPAHW